MSQYGLETAPTIPSRAVELYQRLISLGYDSFTGVPCSYLNALFRVIIDNEPNYFPAPREDIALGFAAGAALAGKNPVAIMQNSGLANSLGHIASLQMLYDLRCLYVVSTRGDFNDGPEHAMMGASTEKLLVSLGISFRKIDAPDALSSGFLLDSPQCALLVPRNWFT